MDFETEPNDPDNVLEVDETSAPLLRKAKGGSTVDDLYSILCVVE